MRVIFLDFDGVVHPLDSGDNPSGRMRWLPHLVELLTAVPDVRIVVHSTWRYQYTDDELRVLLGELGGRFIGSAPRLPREQAIELVLQANKGRVAAHLVLDDDRSEFTTGRLNLVLCDPGLGLSAPRVQRDIAEWLLLTGTTAAPSGRAKVPRGYGEPVVYLDYDGVLHHENVFWDPRRGAYAGPPGFQLFEHAELLEKLLAPYPAVRIVLSTSWVRTYGCSGSAKRLPFGLRDRVVGATFHSKMSEPDFVAKPRGLQVTEDVMRRRPSAWMALDDVDEGWPGSVRSNVVLTDERLGIASPGIEEAIRAQLVRMHGVGVAK
ncbi:HAD domain-containing protein [Hydrogenophaga borbori]